MAYGPVTNRSMLAVLVYLDDADAANGCLQVIPGKLGMLNHSHEGYFQGKITEAFDTSQATLIEAKRGTAIFFSALAPHASRVNTSPRPRRTLIMGFRAADAYPLYLGDRTGQGERFMRVVHGQPSGTARFDLDTVFIPRYPKEAKSLYEIQEYSRQGQESAPGLASVPS
jgi:ectoine hydroxylase-related dioxygenase (phytanoyl-CoA dioxygenase family)